MNVFVLNSGSSSLKFQLIAIDPGQGSRKGEERLCRGYIEGIGGDALMSVQIRNSPKKKATACLPDLSAALAFVVRWMSSHAEKEMSEQELEAEIDAVGHRVVHGGEMFAESKLITDEVLKGIEECISLAPVHNPSSVNAIRASRQVFGPELPQVAVFDTAFHRSIPEHAYLYALPYHLYSRHHIRRYGFHGTSHRYVAEQYATLNGVDRDQVNIITLHLGNGCSAAAIRGGRCVDTSMGMTPLEGLVMGTRSGDLDPAIVNVIASKEGLSAYEVEKLLNTQSGLLGISGITSDMRVLLEEARDRNDRRAQLAIDVFCYRARKYIGAFMAAMGGADAVVFTGGIGENSPEVRACICEGLGWAGLSLDGNANAQYVGTEGQISTRSSTLRAFVIPTDEELLIARDTVRCALEKDARASPNLMADRRAAA